MTDAKRYQLAAAALTVALACGFTREALAQDSDPAKTVPDAAQELAVEGVGKLLQALDLFIKSVPQYAAPEVLENGDIILRRINPTPEPSRPKTGAPDETHT